MASLMSREKVSTLVKNRTKIYAFLRTRSRTARFRMMEFRWRNFYEFRRRAAGFSKRNEI